MPRLRVRLPPRSLPSHPYVTLPAMKRCVTCGQIKPEESFNWRYKDRGIRHPTCRDCHRSYRKAWYEDHKETHLENVYARKLAARQEARQYVLNYLSVHPCTVCGETDPIVLQFHHEGKKGMDVSKMLTDGYPIAKIQAEIDRCVVVCSNCHLRITAKDRGWFRGS